MTSLYLYVDSPQLSLVQFASGHTGVPGQRGSKTTRLQDNSAPGQRGSSRNAVPGTIRSRTRFREPDAFSEAPNAFRRNA